MVYLLTSEKGSYDDYETFTIAIATCPFKAESIKQEYLAKLKEKKLKYTEEEINRLDDEVLGSYEKLTKEQIEFYNWYVDFYLRYYSDNVSIKEIQENIIICNNLND